MKQTSKAENNLCWQRSEVFETFVTCWWECNMVQTLWKTKLWFLLKLNTELPYDPAILLWIYTPKNCKAEGFSSGSVVNNPSANGGDMGSAPDLGRSPKAWSYRSHAAELLSPCSRAWEPQQLSPQDLEPMLSSKRSHRREKPVHCNWRVAPVCHDRKALPAMKTQYSSGAQSCLTLQPHGLEQARLPCPSPTPGACSNSCPLSRWCYPTISVLQHSLPLKNYFKKLKAEIWRDIHIPMLIATQFTTAKM